MTKIFLMFIGVLLSFFTISGKLDYPESENLSHIDASKKLFQSGNSELQKEGFLHLQREAEEGSKYSAGKIGWALQLGLGTEKDLSKAKEYYLLAAKSGMTYWQFLLAHAHHQGYLGFEKSKERYEYWLKYQPKIHQASYECWVINFYDMGLFPENQEAYDFHQNACSDLGHQ